MRVNYVVLGLGEFPTDMLRYDRATIIGTTEILGKKAYLIDGEREPTIGRWNSFLWTVMRATRYYPAGDSERGPIEWKVEAVRDSNDWEKIIVTRQQEAAPA